MSRGPGLRFTRSQMTSRSGRRLGVIVLFATALERATAIVAVERTGRLRLAESMDKGLQGQERRTQQQRREESA